MDQVPQKVDRLVNDFSLKLMGRLLSAVDDESERENIHALAKEHSLDVETMKMLLIYEQTFVSPRDNGTWDIATLKRYADRIRTMGQLFEGFGLARHVNGTAFAWTPRQALRRMLEKRWRLQGLFDFSVTSECDRFNMTKLALLSDFADTLEFILDLIPALQIKKKWLRQCTLTRDLWDLVALTMVLIIVGLLIVGLVKLVRGDKMTSDSALSLTPMTGMIASLFGGPGHSSGSTINTHQAPPKA